MDFSTLGAGPGVSAVEPRDLFAALPSKPRDMDYLRGPQDQVLAEWWNRRSERDLVVKMNTGGGKTLVGLLVALSRLVESGEPVTYLVPDHYLKDQVVEEARSLGIAVTLDPTGYEYSAGKAILVDVLQKVFNGKSIFGIEGTAGRQASAPLPHTVVVDDAHACLAAAERANTLSVPSSDPAFNALVRLFENALREQSASAFQDLEAGLPSALMQVPYWAWADKEPEVTRILRGVQGDDFKFAWPLVADVLSDCQAVFTSDSLDIVPPNANVRVVTGFWRAKHHVYLTATLADDGVLVRDFGADPDGVSRPIVPANAGDIGDRLILAPQLTHPQATQEELRDLVLSLARRQNVAVIVPSRRRAQFWEATAHMVLDKTNLSEGVAAMRGDPSAGLFVFINRYDGVNLPGDACHVLVLDGLPEALDGPERLLATQFSGSNRLLPRQVQRLEQGMGRATRSNDDHCVVLLFGARLAERLHTAAARAAFSPATRAQVEISAQVADQLRDQPLRSIEEVAYQCLDRDRDWIALSRSRLATLRYETGRVDPSVIAGRAAFQAAAARDHGAAVQSMQEAVNGEDDETSKSVLMQQLAAYQHRVDPVGAQLTQKSANTINPNLLRPITGVQYSRISAPVLAQGSQSSSYLCERFADSVELVLGFSVLVDDLDWGPNTVQFEKAWAELGCILGFATQQPERETGRGPDGLWAIGGDRFLVVEAKSGAKADHHVFKDDAKQLSNAMDWFRAEYLDIVDGTPVLIHPSRTFDRKAAVPIGCRIVTTRRLAELRDAIGRLAKGMAHGNAFHHSGQVAELLRAHGLTADTFLDRYTEHARPGA